MAEKKSRFVRLQHWFTSHALFSALEHGARWFVFEHQRRLLVSGALAGIAWVIPKLEAVPTPYRVIIALGAFIVAMVIWEIWATRKGAAGKIVAENIPPASKTRQDSEGLEVLRQMPVGGILSLIILVSSQQGSR